MELKETVDTCEADTELFGCVFTRHFVVVDGLNDAFSEIDGVGFHAWNCTCSINEESTVTSVLVRGLGHALIYGYCQRDPV